jgi:hypothetical protein
LTGDNGAIVGAVEPTLFLSGDAVVVAAVVDVEPNAGTVRMAGAVVVNRSPVSMLGVSCFFDDLRCAPSVLDFFDRDDVDFVVASAPSSVIAVAAVVALLLSAVDDAAAEVVVDGGEALVAVDVGVLFSGRDFLLPDEEVDDALLSTAAVFVDDVDASFSVSTLDANSAIAALDDFLDDDDNFFFGCELSSLLSAVDDAVPLFFRSANNSAAETLVAVDKDFDDLDLVSDSTFGFFSSPTAAADDGGWFVVATALNFASKSIADVLAAAVLDGSDGCFDDDDDDACRPLFFAGDDVAEPLVGDGSGSSPNSARLVLANKSCADTAAAPFLINDVDLPIDLDFFLCFFASSSLILNDWCGLFTHDNTGVKVSCDNRRAPHTHAVHSFENKSKRKKIRIKFITRA